MSDQGSTGSSDRAPSLSSDSGLKTPCLLVASPQMADPFFERTVVLLWHHDQDGAAGLVINRPMPHTISEVIEEAEDYAAAEIIWGGPVEKNRGTVITPNEVSSDSGWYLGHGISVSTSMTTLMDLLDAHAPLLLCLGYAGWGSGQLAKEIDAGSWLFADPSLDILFDTPREALYEVALASIGLSPETVWMTTPADA